MCRALWKLPPQHPSVWKELQNPGPNSCKGTAAGCGEKKVGGSKPHEKVQSLGMTRYDLMLPDLTEIKLYLITYSISYNHISILYIYWLNIIKLNRH